MKTSSYTYTQFIFKYAVMIKFQKMLNYDELLCTRHFILLLHIELSFSYVFFIVNYNILFLNKYKITGNLVFDYGDRY